MASAGSCGAASITPIIVNELFVVSFAIRRYTYRVFSVHSHNVYALPLGSLVASLHLLL